ncbi:hypothetical protein [Salinicola socius]|uniref:Uncharacterized protein n=1 Tax=Salinicola socius TaxID=404433 RepID=A0A1Q8SUV3_9GAMM|nr:hypothetical protein [Salinicola socius]OLO05239.1 hypothetical protein BTW07_04210 [Salinicola socius]
MSASTIIDHPLTGEPTTFPDLARFSGIAKDTLKYRYHQLNQRGAELIEPPTGNHNKRTKTASRADRVRKFQRDLNAWLASPAGRLSTHLFRDFRRGAA